MPQPSSLPTTISMKRCTYEDGELNKQFVIKKDISIEFEESAGKTPKSLEVTFNGKPVKVKASTPENAHSSVRRWTMDNEICIGPDSGHPLVFRVTYAVEKKNGLRGIFKTQKDTVEINLGYSGIAREVKQQYEVKFSVTQQACTVSLGAVRAGNYSVIVESSIHDLDPLLPKSIQNIIGSGDTFLRNAHPLPSILEKIPLSEDAWWVIDCAIDAVGEASPLAKAILTALSIPYKLLKNELEFKQNVQDLAETMRFTVKYIVDIQDHTKIESAKDQLISIMTTIREAAQYVNAYVSKGKIGQFLGAQFPSKLDEFTDSLVEKKNRFQIAMTIQIARSVDMITSMTVDDFLRKNLRPFEGNERSPGCLAGTRTKILEEIRHWLHDRGSKENILWLVGPPGSGKSTIATTIAEDLEAAPPFCATFSCKRDVPKLRDPRNIWPTLAFSLANKHDGVKAALMTIVNEKKGNLLNGPVVGQFEKLIGGPLDNDWEQMSMLSRTSAYPVIIIDALDECYTTGDDDWNSLLLSLACWSKLCETGVAKLIVTSRHRDDISAELIGLSHLIRLTTGDDVSPDSKADVGIFFKERFGKERINLGIRDPNWPGNWAIEKMTDYAAGLFIWADMVVQYIGQRTGGRDPIERLRAVLNDVETHTGIDGASRVDRLYARIVFEAFQHSTDAERKRAKSTLATIVLAKVPLGIDDLIELQSTNTWDARNATESTLQTLSPFIPNRGFDNKLRVCHRTVSEFLLSPYRSQAAMEYVVKRWEQQMPRAQDQVSEPESFIIDPKEEERNLALACVRLVYRKLTKGVRYAERLLKDTMGLLDYAFHHWFEHLEVTTVSRMADLKSLADAMKVAYESAKRYASNPMLVKEDFAALIACLRGAANVVIQSIGYDRIIDHSENYDILQDVRECARDLDFVRGCFQIAMVEKLTSQSSESFLRKQLRPSDQTVLDRPCLEGTRTRVLNRVKEWAKDPEQPNVMWIVGAPGAGKSAIARTLVEAFSKDGMCAKTFAKRDFEDRRDPTRIWSTLAYDVTHLHVGLKGSIMDELFKASHQSVSDILDKALRDQQYLSLVFILDAVDECFTEGDGRWRALVRALATWADFPRSVKLLVTSRDIPDIRKALEDISTSISLKADSEDSKKEAKSDMEVFFRTRFMGELKDSEDVRYWTRADVIFPLIERAADSFIWAKMFVELVKLNPHSCLDDILTFKHPGSDRTVDVLYAKMLLDVFGPVPEKEREVLRSVLAFIVLAKNPLRKVDLVKLLQASSRFLSTDGTRRLVTNAVKELSSVISIGDNGLLRIPHKSFADFLLDHDYRRSLSAMKQLLPARYDPHSFIVNHEDSANITIACLQIMHNSLKFNLCGIETSHTLNYQIPDLEVRISENIRSSLDYARRFWAEHLSDCSQDAQELRGQLEPLLEKLLNQNFLYWLEILSLAKAVPSARRSLDVARTVLEGYSKKLAEVAKDADKFVEMFEAPIAAAVPHIYLSALPFCPSDSWIAQIYGPRYLNVVSVVEGRRTEWENDVTTMPNAHTESVLGVAFFPDGRLVSGSDDKSVRIWDSRSGQALSTPFTGRRYSSVSSVAVSPGGSQIAIGDSRGTLRLWHSNTGTCPLGRIRAHDECIHSIAFSPNGSHIVTGSEDKTAKVWNVATGDLCFRPLTGHIDDVKCVAFSIDGTVIASGSDDKTIRIWDAHTGEPRREPLTRHNHWVHCIAFSADGRHLASGSFDNTIRLWDILRGFSLTCTIYLEHKILSLSFSSVSNRLVSGSGDGTVRFWNVGSGIIEQVGVPIYGHADYVSSVTFAPDGQSVASGSWDHSVKIWSARSSSATSMITGAGQYPSPASFNSESLHSRGRPVLGDDSFIDENGWMRASREEGAGVLFWVPKENRKCIWWTRNTAVMHRCVTKFDFRRFVHGENWTQCRTSAVTDVI